MITIFTNIKDENRYLEQWIEYHIKLGFEEFILFEDEGSKPHDDIIKQFDSNVKILLYKGVLRHDNIEFKDLTCFKFVFQNHPEVTWGIKLDPDEYLDLGKYTTIHEYISFLQSQINNQITEIVFNWHLYNANGRVYEPSIYKYNLLETYKNEINVNELNFKASTNISKNIYSLPKTLMLFTYFQDRSDDIINKNIAIDFPHRLLVTNIAINAEYSTGAYIKHFITKSFNEYYKRLKLRGEHSPEWFRKLGDFFVLNPDMIPMKHDIELIYDINIDNFETKLNVKNVLHSKD